MQQLIIDTHTPMQKNNSKVHTLQRVLGPEELDLLLKRKSRQDAIQD